MWEQVPAASGGKHWRIALCPPGFAMKRDPLSPDNDDCIRCTQGFYRLKPTRWKGPNVSLPPCYACPKGARCPGGDIVEAFPGYWRLQTKLSGGYEYLDSASDVCQVEGAEEGTECLFPSGIIATKTWSDNPMRCTLLPQVSSGLVCARQLTVQLADRRKTSNKDTDDQLDDADLINTEDSQDEDCSAEIGSTCGSARVYRCSLLTCDMNNTCFQNRTGPLCGMCLPGFAMTTEGCSSASCPTEEELHLWRGVAIAVIILVFLVGWFILCWRPVLPEAEWAIAHIMTGIVSLWSCFMCFNNTSCVSTTLQKKEILLRSIIVSRPPSWRQFTG